MLRNRGRNSFRATLLAGVSGLALMVVIALPIGAAKAQSSVLVNNGGPPLNSATTNLTVDGSGSNLTVPGSVTAADSVSAVRGNFALLHGTQLVGSIDANSNNITNARNISATGTVGAGDITATGSVSAGSVSAGSVSAGTVRGTRGYFELLGATQLDGDIDGDGYNITGVYNVDTGFLNAYIATLDRVTVETTLGVTGATTTNGISNTGNVGTGTLSTTGLATLNRATVTGATITNGITNTGNVGTGTLRTTGLATLNRAAVTGAPMNAP